MDFIKKEWMAELISPLFYCVWSVGYFFFAKFSPNSNLKSTLKKFGFEKTCGFLKFWVKSFLVLRGCPFSCSSLSFKQPTFSWVRILPIVYRYVFFPRGQPFFFTSVVDSLVAQCKAASSSKTTSFNNVYFLANMPSSGNPKVKDWPDINFTWSVPEAH